MLDFNIGLLLEIFFVILVGMIFGLTLISFNLQRLVEQVIVHSILFLETKSMKLLVIKNLSAHRESNRMTSIIYSLTLGTIIFVIVAANLQISLFTTNSLDGNMDLRIEADGPWFYAKDIDPVLIQYKDYITSFGLQTAMMGH